MPIQKAGSGGGEKPQPKPQQGDGNKPLNLPVSTPKHYGK